MWWLGRCPASSFGAKLKVHEPATHNGIGDCHKGPRSRRMNARESARICRAFALPKPQNPSSSHRSLLSCCPAAAQLSKHVRSHHVSHCC